MKARPHLPRDPSRRHLEALVTRVREQQGHLSEADFCHAHGLPRTPFGEWLGRPRDGKLRSPRVEHVYVLAGALGVTPQQVLYACCGTGCGSCSGR